MSELVASSVPFVRFRVQRVLAQGDHASPEGRDRMLEQLRPVLGPLPAGAMRMELTRIVSERLSLPPSLVERALAEGGASSMVGGDGREAVGHTGVRGGGRTNGGAAGAGAAAGRAGAGESAAARERAGAGGRASAGGDAGASLSARGVSTERAFLALCIASPGAGEQALAELDLEESFTSELLRRAAAHLRAHLTEPQRGLPEDDPELASLVATLVVEAGRESAREHMLEVQRLQLELARMDRQIQRTRASQGGGVSELARRRTEVKRDFERAYARVLEETAQGEG